MQQQAKIIYLLIFLHFQSAPAKDSFDYGATLPSNLKSQQLIQLLPHTTYLASLTQKTYLHTSTC